MMLASAPGVARLQTASSLVSRVYELDALRGLAALAVVAYHYTTLYGELYGHLGPDPISFAFGNYGVHLFFLISGFVIFMTLERTRTAMDFVVSRFSRLFPAYWAAILISAAVIYSIGMSSQQLPWKDVVIDFTMIQEFLGAEHLDGSYWTLEVELFFYAQMLFWYMCGQLKRIHWIIGGWLILAILYGVTTRLDLHFSHTVRELLILRHIPFFAIGILFYRIRTYPGELRLNAALIAASIVAIAIAYPPVFSMVALICTAIFTLFVSNQLKWLRAVPFTFLGAISYSLYLLHQAIGFTLIWRFEMAGLPPGTAGLCAALVVTVLATLLTYLIERPAMRMIRDAWKKRRPAVAPA